MLSPRPVADNRIRLASAFNTRLLNTGTVVSPSTTARKNGASRKVSLNAPSRMTARGNALPPKEIVLSTSLTSVPAMTGIFHGAGIFSRRYSVPSCVSSHSGTFTAGQTFSTRQTGVSFRSTRNVAVRFGWSPGGKSQTTYAVPIIPPRFRARQSVSDSLTTGKPSTASSAVRSVLSSGTEIAPRMTRHSGPYSMDALTGVLGFGVGLSRGHDSGCPAVSPTRRNWNRPNGIGA